MSERARGPGDRRRRLWLRRRRGHHRRARRDDDAAHRSGAARPGGRRLRRLRRAGDRPTSSTRPRSSSRRSRPATSRRPRPPTRPPACTSSGSSRSPAPSATSTPTSTAARATSRPTDWGGYHRIEKALWIDETTDGLEQTIKELRNDVANLNDIAIKADFDPVEIAQGSVDLLAEVSASKITGEEERYSHTDLWDFEANVEGAEAGFEALEPALEQVDPELVDEIEPSSSRPCTRCSTSYREGDGFVLYDTLSDEADPGARAADRHARRVAVEGAGRGRVTDGRAANDAPRRGLPAAACSRRPGSPAPGSGSAPAASSLGHEAAEASTGDGTGTVPFWGERQAGIVTAQQDRLHFAAFDVTADDPRRARVELLREWTEAAARMTAGELAGPAQRRGAAAARRHRRGDRAPAEPADDHLRLRARACSSATASTASGSRGSRPPSLRQFAAAAGRGDRPGDLGRRPLRSGVLRRPAGRLPRGPQPGADRPRVGGHEVVAARLRPHLDHDPRAGHAAQPDGAQGRHQQHPRRGHRATWSEFVWVGDEAPGVAARRHLPRHPPDPDGHRELGPHRPGRAGAHDRPRQVLGRPARPAATSSTRPTSRRAAPRAR